MDFSWTWYLLLSSVCVLPHEQTATRRPSASSCQSKAREHSQIWRMSRGCVTFSPPLLVARDSWACRGQHIYQQISGIVLMYAFRTTKRTAHCDTDIHECIAPQKRECIYTCSFRFPRFLYGDAPHIFVTKARSHTHLHFIVPSFSVAKYILARFRLVADHLHLTCPLRVGRRGTCSLFLFHRTSIPADMFPPAASRRPIYQHGIAPRSIRDEPLPLHSRHK